MKPQIKAFYDQITGTITYAIYDEVGGHAAIIDPVLDYDPKSGRTKTHLADQVIDFVHQQQLSITWILETHAHADHLSAARYLQTKLGGRIGIGEHITQVQSVFKKMFHLEADFAVNGSQFDHLFADNETFQVGHLTSRALFVPGHTPADMAYQFNDAVFVGDTLFMPDVGSARCDFPGEMRTHSINPYSDSLRCHPLHDFSCATTIRPTVAMLHGKLRLPSNEKITFTCAMQLARQNLFAFAKPATPHSKCRY
jgi:glyoxylase-like metal-dependent hydrolase (beta-lactamase superfamily II)